MIGSADYNGMQILIFQQLPEVTIQLGFLIVCFLYYCGFIVQYIAIDVTQANTIDSGNVEVILQVAKTHASAADKGNVELVAGSY